MEQLKQKIRTYSTAMILECLVQIGGGQVDIDKNNVRAALIGIYEEREGEEATDALLDSMGM